MAQIFSTGGSTLSLVNQKPVVSVTMFNHTFLLPIRIEVLVAIMGGGVLCLPVFVQAGRAAFSSIS